MASARLVAASGAVLVSIGIRSGPLIGASTNSRVTSVKLV